MTRILNVAAVDSTATRSVSATKTTARDGRATPKTQWFGSVDPVNNPPGLGVATSRMDAGEVAGSGL